MTWGRKKRVRGMSEEKREGGMMGKSEREVRRGRGRGK